MQQKKQCGPNDDAFRVVAGVAWVNGHLDVPSRQAVRLTSTAVNHHTSSCLVTALIVAGLL